MLHYLCANRNMSSIQLRTLNRQGSTPAASGSNAAHGDSRSAVATEGSTSSMPVYSPEPSLQQQQRQQQPQRLSHEGRRLRIQLIPQLLPQIVQHVSTPTQQTPQQAVSNSQRNNKSRLGSFWKKKSLRNADLRLAFWRLFLPL
jgi:hypothetical protein